MSEFTLSDPEQLAISTAEDERNYFTGEQEISLQPNPNAILPPGTYRVIEGSLYRIMGGIPPKFPAVRSEGDSFEGLPQSDQG